MRSPHPIPAPILRAGPRTRSADRRRGQALLALAGAVLVLVTGCGGGATADVTVIDAWARTSPVGAATGAAYMTIRNAGSAADALVGVRSTIAAATELHETYVVDASMPGHGMGSPDPMASPGGGMMGMRPVARVEIPAGGTLELAPGGYHVMLIGLDEALVAGETIELVLVLERAGEVTVTVEVRRT